MPRAARLATAPDAPADEVGPALRFKLEHPRCAKCGHEATLGMMLTDGPGTGPWLCGPSSYPPPGRAGCRLRRP